MMGRALTGLAALGLLWAGCGATGAGACTDPICTMQPPPAGLHYAVELVPSENSMLVPQQFAQLQVDPQGRVELVFSEPATLSGRVYIGDATMPMVPSIAAHISATLKAAEVIPGKPLSFDADSMADIGFGDKSYKLPLVPGTYNLRVTTHDPSQPPVTLVAQVPGDRMLDIVLPTQDKLVTISGIVQSSHGPGVNGVKVHLVETASGRAVSTEVVTSTQGASQDGSFVLAMQRSPGTYTLIAEPDSPSTALPTLRRSVTIPSTGNVSNVMLVLPDQSTAQYQFAISGYDGAAMANVQLRFHADLPATPDPATQAAFDLSVLADDYGYAQVNLLQGHPYVVTVQTSPTSPYSSVTLENVSLDGQHEQQIMLPRKITVGGTVLGADRKPILNAVVQAYGVTDNGTKTPGVAPAVMTNVASALTNASGQYQMVVEPGHYDLEVTPPDGSTYPRWALMGVGVDGSPINNANYLGFDITLPVANRISGRVLDPAGKPQASADVRIYLVSQDGTYARLRGEAQTMTDGTFMLVLPNPTTP